MNTFLRALSVGLIALVGLVLALYAWENWSGAHAWTAARHDLEARGEYLDWAYFIPPPIPDSQNLALAPFFARELGYARDPKTSRLTISHQPPFLNDDFRNPPYGKFYPMEKFHLPGPEQGFALANLPTLQKFHREHPEFPHSDQPGAPADDILLALTFYAPALDELAREAAARPAARFPVDWSNPNPLALTLPHLWLVQELVQTLRLRASVELTAGHPADALRDVRLALRLGRTCTEPAMVIGDLVAITCTSLSLSPIWQGVAERRWSAEDLAALQADLQSIDPLADYVAAARGERAGRPGELRLLPLPGRRRLVHPGPDRQPVRQPCLQLRSHGLGRSEQGVRRALGAARRDRRGRPDDPAHPARESRE